MKKEKQKLIFLFFTLIISLQLLYSDPVASETSSKRKFNDPKMLDGSEPTRGTWKGKLDRVKEALKNIQRKIENPDSDINRELSPCVRDALKNLYDPIMEGWEDVPDNVKQLEVKLATQDIHPNPNSSEIVFMSVNGKSGYHPNVNDGTYHGNMRGEIRIYPAAFDRKYSDCLEGNLKFCEFNITWNPFAKRFLAGGGIN